MLKKLFLVILIVLIGSLAYCEKIPIKSIKIQNKEINLKVFETISLDYTLVPIEANGSDVNITSSNENVAFMFNGKLLGIGLGEAIITVSSKTNPNIKDTCKVIVKDFEIEKITLPEKEISLKVLETKEIKIDLLPELADYSKIILSSSNENVVLVSDNTVFAIGEGEATLTVSSKKNPNIKDTCKIIVKESEVEKIILEEKEISLKLADRKFLKIKTMPEIVLNLKLDYKSSDENVVVVYNGEIIGVGEGEATITVASKTNPEIKDTCKIIVKDCEIEKITLKEKELNIKVRENRKINMDVLPEYVDFSKLVYTSSDENIVFIYNGMITGISKGEAIISVSSKSNPEIKDTCKVIVNELETNKEIKSEENKEVSK